MDLSQLPVRQREGAAQVAARRHDPVADAEHCIVWKGGYAHLWIWPPAGDFTLPDDHSWIPESLLRAAPDRDGARLLQQLEGYEGQLWRDGSLAASRWWPQAPDPSAWAQFLRASGVAHEPGAGVPKPDSLPWASTPWGESKRGLPASPAILERLGWLALGCILALGLGWQLAGLARWEASLARVDARTETLRTQAMPLLEARERADVALQLLRGYSELRQSVSDYVVMAELLDPLPADARLRGWIREGDRLDAALESSNTDPREYVSAFDGHPRLYDVVASPDPDANGIGLSLRVLTGSPAVAEVPQ